MVVCVVAEYLLSETTMGANACSHDKRRLVDHTHTLVHSERERTISSVGERALLFSENNVRRTKSREYT